MPKDKQSGLGRALQNRLQKKKQIGSGDKAPIFFQQTEQNDADIKKMKMKSVIDQNSLSEFLQIAQLSQKNFQANRDIKFKQIREQLKNKKIIFSNKSQHSYIQQTASQQILLKLQMPRRPDWHNLTKQQFQQAQNQAYLIWRRKLANVQQTQQNIQLTPYQKNIEVWRQLWRVTERADLLVQIVDGRDPMFFRSQDLIEYLKELNPDKKSLLLVNKSDLVSTELRQKWNEYFIEHSIDHVFFSAKQEHLEHEDQLSENTKEESDRDSNINQDYLNQARLLNTWELTQLLNSYVTNFKKPKIQVGFVGYPNVGKSSVINTLIGKKKVGVASMPGKTKHFQTLALTDAVTLCDCPGLVFPRVSSTFAEMILNGLYPIDTIKNHEEVIQIIALRIPQKVIEKTYALSWKEDDMYDAETILSKYATLKGLYTGNGLPNQSTAARYITKDYVNGILVYAKNPPQNPQQKISQEMSHHHTQQQNQKTQLETNQLQQNQRKKQQKAQQQLDNQFFVNYNQKSKQTDHELIDQLTQQDLLDILEGKKMPFKITKEMRRDIKHAMKQQHKDLQTIKQMLKGYAVVCHKTLIKL